MELNQDTDTDDPGRTIGNGVVIAHAAVIALLGVLAVMDKIDGAMAVYTAIGVFVLVFGGDIFMQWYDMNHSGETPSGPAARLQADGGDETPAEQ